MNYILILVILGGSFENTVQKSVSEKVQYQGKLRKTRNVIADSFYKWPEGKVYYQYSDSVRKLLASKIN